MSATTGSSSKLKKFLTIGVVVLLVLAAVWYFFLRDNMKTIYAQFPVATGLYEDNEVRLLGVTIGKVIALEPDEQGVTVEMRVEKGVDLPENIGALITNRTLVADRYVELVLPPRDERVGQLQDGATILRDKTDVPIDYDMLLTSAQDLAAALNEGDRLGGVRETIEKMGEAFDGIGPDANRAIEEFAGATRVLAGSSEEIDQLLEVFGNIARMINERDGQIREFTAALGVLAAEAGRQDVNLGTMISDVRTMFNEVDRLVSERSGDITGLVNSLDVLAATLASNPVEIAEIVDVFPLLGQNVERMTDNGKIRIRLDISSQLQQIPGLAAQCAGAGAALCTGAGFTNPIAVPFSASDPLNLGGTLGNPIGGGQ